MPASQTAVHTGYPDNTADTLALYTPGDKYISEPDELGNRWYLRGRSWVYAAGRQYWGDGEWVFGYPKDANGQPSRQAVSWRHPPFVDCTCTDRTRWIAHPREVVPPDPPPVLGPPEVADQVEIVYRVAGR